MQHPRHLSSCYAQKTSGASCIGSELWVMVSEFAEEKSSFFGKRMHATISCAVQGFNVCSGGWNGWLCLLWLFKFRLYGPWHITNLEWWSLRGSRDIWNSCLGVCAHAWSPGLGAVKLTDSTFIGIAWLQASCKDNFAVAIASCTMADYLVWRWALRSFLWKGENVTLSYMSWSCTIVNMGT